MYGSNKSMELRESANYVWSLSFLLGKGAHGNVYRGSNKTTGEAVAVKVVKDLKDRERQVLLTIQHKNIVKLIAIEQEKPRRGVQNDVIVMELCRGGSLSKILEDPEYCFGLSEHEFLIFLDNLYTVTRYLREAGIAHRDYKPANWVKYEGDDGETMYKLTDFGAAKELKEDEAFFSLHGTPDYLDPDVYAQAFLKGPDQPKTEFTSSIDLWSIGTTIYEVATGKLPFRPYRGNKDPKTMVEMRYKKATGVICCHQTENDGPIYQDRTLPDDCRLSPALKELLTPLLSNLMEADPKKKITYEDFFSQIKSILERRRLHVFFLNRVERIRLYLSTASDKPGQNLINHELCRLTEVEPINQMLFFMENSLTEFTNNKSLDVKSLPTTTEENPIILCNKDDDDIKLDKIKLIYRKTAFSNRIDAVKDYEIGRRNCCVAYYQKRMITDIVSRVKLIHVAVDTINKVVIKQLTVASKDNLQIHNVVNSLTRQFQMMKYFSMSSESFLGLVPRELMDSKKKIVASMESAYEVEYKEFQNLLKKLQLLSPSIESLLKERVENRHLVKDWESKYQQIPRVKEFEKADKTSSTVLERVRLSYLCVSGEDNHALPLGSTEETGVYLMARIKLMRKMDSLENVLNYSSTTFEAFVSIFSDWYKQAQTAFIQPEILNKEINSLRESLLNCEENLGKSFKKYQAELEKFPDGIAAAKANRKTLKEDKKESLSSLNRKLAELKQIHHEIYTFFEANQHLCDQLQNIITTSKNDR